MMKKLHLSVAVAYGAVFLLLLATAFAAQPTVISLQGKLTNSSTGALITSANVFVNISSFGGQTVWNETFVNGVSNGFFDLLLGTNADNPLNLTFDQDYNISISAGSTVAQIGGTYRFRSGVGQISPSNLSSGNFSAPGNFSFGGSMFIDKTSNRVGIGTAAPTTALDVAGTVTATAGGRVWADGHQHLQQREHQLVSRRPQQLHHQDGEHLYIRPHRGWLCTAQFHLKSQQRERFHFTLEHFRHKYVSPFYHIQSRHRHRRPDENPLRERHACSPDRRPERQGPDHQHHERHEHHHLELRRQHHLPVGVIRSRLFLARVPLEERQEIRLGRK
ncbi:hypothetical protein J4435_04945 [Candidatus Woesearchaeota archaeon]|nr:hypothetical protein [Candidatus Woesearchaeota archaeon]